MTAGRSETELWAASGAMALTGRPDGEPLLGTGRPTTLLNDALEQLTALGVAAVPGLEVLGERAALTGRTRNAPWSVGGRFSILPAADGWFALSLARPSDVDLLPALIDGPVDADPWPDVERWLAQTTTAAAEARAVLLGLPAAPVPITPTPPHRPPVITTPGGPCHRSDRPLVLDLSSLWAGPLCAHLLGHAGADVVKLESRTRPDAARAGTPELFNLLHAGHRSVVLDFDRQRDTLVRLVARADVVIESSRPRALAHLGIDAHAEISRGAVWVSITAAGRTDGQRVGFGDDVAAGAGLVAWTGGVPYPMGDALADPLTGVVAAEAALTALRDGRGALIDVSMHDICASAAVQPRTGPVDVVAAAPKARVPSAPAAAFGADTAAVLAEWTR